MAEKKSAFSNIWCSIISKQSEKALEVEALSVENGGGVQVSTPNGTDNQLWSFISVDNTYYQLICKSSNKALDIIASGTNDGAWVHQWEIVLGTDSQLWSVQETEDGFYKIKSKLSNKCLDVVAISSDDGAKVQIWQDLDGDNQKWKITATVAARTRKKPTAKRAASAATTSASTKKAKSDSTRVLQELQAEPQQMDVSATVSTEKPVQAKRRGRRPAKLKNQII